MAITCYLEVNSLDELAVEAGIDPEDAEEVLAVIQRFDPVGVAARSLAECSSVQAEVLGYDAIELSIIRNHLPCGEEGDVASKAVKDAIKNTIAREDRDQPVSDQTLVRLLAADRGLTIARRTVAKYRESLRIPSSALRKKTL